MTTVSPFDRHTFDPVNNWQDQKYLRTLRQKGSRRRFLYTCRHKYGWGTEYLTPYSFGWYKLVSRYFFCSIPNKGKVFLDLGCGNSADAAFANREMGMESFAIDLFPPSANEDGYTDKDKFTFIQSDIVESIPMKPESVDSAMCSAVIDLIHPSERMLFYRNVYECLKPGAKFVVSIVSLSRGHGVNGNEERERLCRSGFGVICNSVSSRIIATK